MALHHNPRIVTDGLVLHLDAANTKSFRGEPTVNLFTTPIDLSGDDWSIGNTPSEITRTWDQLDSDGTNNALKFESIDSAYYPHTNFSFTPENTNDHTITCYIKSLIGNQSLYIILFKVSPWASIGGYEIITVTSEWQRFSMTRNPLDTTQHRVFIGVHLATAPISSFLIHKVQMEEKSYDTPFVNGTRGTTVATGGGLIDLNGNENSGTFVNGVTYDSDNCGNLVFDGDDDYVDCGSLSNFNHGTGNFSVSFITKFVYKDQDYWGQGFVGGGGFAFRVYASSVKYTIGSISNQYPSVSSLAYDQIWFVTFTVDRIADDLNWYKNTIFQCTTDISSIHGDDISNETSIVIGKQEGYLRGKLYNVKIYNRVLTPTEITQNYNALKGRFGL